MRYAAALLVLCAVLPASARAQALPPGLEGVGFVQELGAQVPRDLVFTDSRGNEASLGSLTGDRPVVLALVYHRCPMLCSMVLEGLVRGLSGTSLDVGEDFHVLVVSFDPADTPAEAASQKAQALRRYGRKGAEQGWHFLTGEPEAVEALTRAVGFRYSHDPATGEFAHAAGVVVLTPEGRVARYLFGVDFAPRDLRLSLVEASQGAVGTPVDAILLYCFHYDPARGRYGAVVMNMLRLGGAVTVLLLGGTVLVLARRSRRREARP